MTVRVIVPDSHGDKIDYKAANAFLKDLKALNADEIVFLGDHVDANGTFNSHHRTYGSEMEESYAKDVGAANCFLDEVDHVSPKSKKYMLKGNHEQHVETWAAKVMLNKSDVDMFLDRLAPEFALNLRERGIKYFHRDKQYMGISVPGTIKLGKCFFTHGISASTHAAAVHVNAFSANVVFGHCHRAQSFVKKTVTSGAIGGWCPGTLSKLQPLYRHTTPTAWTHGYAVQFVNKSGLFQHINVSIVNGKSLLAESGLLGAA